MADASNIKMAMKLQQITQVGQPDADGWLPVSFTAGPMSLAERHQALQARDRGPDLPETP